MAQRAVPTIDDLRVKLCYICREEDRFDNPENPPRQWTHPCSCTLIAHESCLLQWIQSAQSNASRAPNALKCPQCGTKYELESENPMILRIMASGNHALSTIGKLFTVLGFTTVIAACGSSIYIMGTAYGAYALQQFIGKEMYDLLLTDDPSNWPWHAWFNLPLIPLSLILSRTSSANHVLPLIPILLPWPTSQPVVSTDRIWLAHWARSENAEGLANTALPIIAKWPPSPLLFGLFIFPTARALYHRYFTQFSHWILDTRPLPEPPVRRWVWALNGPFAIHIGADVERRQVPVQEQQGQQLPAAAPVEQGDQEPNAAVDAAAAAEHTIEIGTSSLGRLVGGALLIPAISSAMGSLLFRLSKRSTILRQFLAIRPPLRGFPHSLGSYSFDQNRTGKNRVKEMGTALRLLLGSIWGGSRAWSESDPVWWRNSVGLGLFVVAKDCIQLLHLWLTKRELETRHVKNRSFEGVDIRELDLINPSFQSG